MRLFFVPAVLLFFSCSRDPMINLQDPNAELQLEVPQGWPSAHYDFSANKITADGFALGRALFYEEMLSKDNSISCATCHRQSQAFADAGQRLSKGVDGRTGKRNSPALFNLAWHPAYMHDGGINHLEVQPPAPITDENEMAQDLKELVKELSASQKYRTMFKAAFGKDSITTAGIFKALAQFNGLMISSTSKYDKVKRQERDAAFTATEQKGYTLFLKHCNHCHREPLFSDFSYRSNGLSPLPAVTDSGRGRITKKGSDYFKFKVPSLRNVVLTYPYMHDGRYTSLEECLEHYSRGAAGAPNPDPLIYEGLALSQQDKSDIIDFLYTLTDYEFLHNEKFSDPGQP